MQPELVLEYVFKSKTSSFGDDDYGVTYNQQLGFTGQYVLTQ